MNESIEEVLFSDSSDTMDFWERFKKEYDQETEKLIKRNNGKNQQKINT